MSKNILLIGQGSQTIQLVREMFSLNFKPSEIFILTVDDISNNCFIEFIKYYAIEFLITRKSNFDHDLSFFLKKDIELIISFSNPFIINSKFLESATFINFHPGLLPLYRGSFSTVHAMINKDSKTGGTWHYISKKVDYGNIIIKFDIKISSDSTAFSLNHQVFSIGVSQLKNVLKLLKENYSGELQSKSDGNFYFNKFPDLKNIKDDNLKSRINFFPPKFK